MPKHLKPYILFVQALINKIQPLFAFMEKKSLTHISNIFYILQLSIMTHNKQREFRVRSIPDELYKHFKIVSVLKGVTVNELFLEAMTEIVEKENNKK